MTEILKRSELVKPLTAKAIKKHNAECGVLYKLIRHRLGITQTVMAKMMRTTLDAIVNRERRKRVYSVSELVALQRISGLSDTEWGDMLRDIAK